MHNERQGSKVWVDQSFQIRTPTLTLNFLFTLNLKKKKLLYINCSVTWSLCIVSHKVIWFIWTQSINFASFKRINKKKGVEASLAAGMAGRRSSRLSVFVLLWSWVTRRLISFSFCQCEGVQMHEVDTAQVTFEWRGCQCSECKTPQTCYKKASF